MTNWFISINGEQKGPYPTDQLRQLVSDGFVARDAYVWREGMAQWQPLSQVRLSDDPAAAPVSVPQSRETGYGQQFQQTQSYSGQQQSDSKMNGTSDYVKPGYFSFYGRISRKTFWLSYVLLSIVILALVSVPLGFVMPKQDADPSSINYTPMIAAGVAFFVVYLAIMIAMLSANVKRLHDRGRSGWFVLLSLVPIANIWILIEVAFLKGTNGPNEYGADPVG